MSDSTARRLPWGMIVALAAGLYACRSTEGERCVCADDCRSGLVCLAQGRVLAPGECSPAFNENTNPGVCLSEDEALDGDDGGGPPTLFMDLGAKRDFDPGPPPDDDSGTATGTGTGSTTSDPMTSSSSGGTSSGGTSSGTSGSGGTSSGGTSSGGTSSGGTTTSGSSSGS